MSSYKSGKCWRPCFLHILYAVTKKDFLHIFETLVVCQLLSNCGWIPLLSTFLQTGSCQALSETFMTLLINEPPHEKSNNLHMRNQRRR